MKAASAPTTESLPESLGQDEESPFTLGLLLRQAHDHVAITMDTALAPFGLERRHLVVLMRLTTDGPLPQQALVERTHHDKAAMVRIVDDLERLGLASRELVPGDRRLRAVTLSDRGREVIRDARQAAVPAAADASRALDAGQLAELTHLLRLLAGH
jgi:DNA-binding MarR family transcriptional regulator